MPHRGVSRYKIGKMGTSWISPTFFLFLFHHQLILAENPCEGMTVADCTVTPDVIIKSYPFPTAEVCDSQCDTEDICRFWRFFKNDTVTECLHSISANYHKVGKHFDQKYKQMIDLE